MEAQAYCFISDISTHEHFQTQAQLSKETLQLHSYMLNLQNSESLLKSLILIHNY